MLEKILKIVRSIDGCSNTVQLEVAYNMLENFLKTDKPEDERIIEDLRNYYKFKFEELDHPILK